MKWQLSAAVTRPGACRDRRASRRRRLNQTKSDLTRRQRRFNNSSEVWRTEAAAVTVRQRRRGEELRLVLGYFSFNISEIRGCPILPPHSTQRQSEKMEKWIMQWNIPAGGGDINLTDRERFIIHIIQSGNYCQDLSSNFTRKLHHYYFNALKFNHFFFFFECDTVVFWILFFNLAYLKFSL